MKRIANMIAAIALCTFIVTVAVGTVIAADKILDTTVRSVTQSIDKRGNEYVRIIVADQRELNGVKYETDAALMAFGAQVPEAKTIKANSKIKAIVNGREYNGRLSYTLLKLLK